MSRSFKSTLKDTHRRTVAKTISWRVVATLTTITLVYIFTGEALKSLEVGFFEVISKITFYYFHERAWGRISWGKKAHPLAEIPISRDIAPEDMLKIEQQLRDLGYLD